MPPVQGKYHNSDNTIVLEICSIANEKLADFCTYLTTFVAYHVEKCQ